MLLFLLDQRLPRGQSSQTIIVLLIRNVRELTNTPWYMRCVSSVAVVNKDQHIINAVVVTIIARMRVWTIMAA